MLIDSIYKNTSIFLKLPIDIIVCCAILVCIETNKKEQEMKISKRALNIARLFTDRKTVRPVLNSIHFEDGDVVATDSYQLVIVKGGADTEIKATISNDFTRKVKSDGIFEGIDEDKSSITWLDPKTYQRTVTEHRNIQTVPCAYPDYKKLIKPIVTATVSIDPKRLKLIAQAAIDAHETKVTLGIGNAVQPIYFAFGDDTLGLVMPLRDDKNEDDFNTKINKFKGVE